MEFELPKDFKELFALLNANSVRYLLIGGYAVGIYGYSRTTNDIDIFVSDEPDNVANLYHALVEFGFAGSDLGPDLFPEQRSMLEMGVEPMKIQMMNFADGLEFNEAYARRNSVEVQDIVIHIVSKHDLIKNKVASGRHKDLADIERLEKLD